MVVLPLLLGLLSLGGIAARGPQSGQPPGDSNPLAMISPWWENYDIKERYLCSEKGGVVLERNASQASLISGGSRMTLFRESGDGPAMVYRNDEMRLILRGDELTLERLPMKIVCLRSEDV
jgi:hypothetical protein